MQNKKFWFCYVEGGGAPTFKHETEEKAREEAERLAYNNPGKGVFVLEAKAYAIYKPVFIMDLNGIPF